MIKDERLALYFVVLLLWTKWRLLHGGGWELGSLEREDETKLGRLEIT